MHPALYLPEITANIFEFLNPFLSEPTPNLRLRDILAVALTCRTLSHPALDVLWDTQLCLGPLFMCMSLAVVQVCDADEPGERRSIVRDLIIHTILTDSLPLAATHRRPVTFRFDIDASLFSKDQTIRPSYR